MSIENEYKTPEEIIDNLILRYIKKYENDELREIRETSKNVENPEKIKELKNRYLEIAQSLTNDPEDQLGIMFACALILKNSGDIEGFLSELHELRIYALGFGWVGIGLEVSKLIDLFREESI